MTLEELRAKVREWDAKNTGGQVATSYFQTILNELDYHATREWRVYLPAQHPDFNASYMERLASWIGNLADEDDQKLFLEYALHISFFSHDDFVALYRTALDREVTRWIACQIGLSNQPDIQAFQDVIQKTIHRHTWFCPVTDSMDINEFYKANHLQGVGHRPCFATLHMLAEMCDTQDTVLTSNLVHYMKNSSLDPSDPSPPIEYLVLLEDIVGSGTQCLDAVKWAVANLGKPVLFIPLILCPNGADALRIAEKQLGGRLTVRPIIELCRGDLLGPERQGSQNWNKTQEMEALAMYCHKNNPFNYSSAFGYRDTGSSLVTFSNTPDNTLPLVHDRARSGTWKPLFPRVYRDS